MNTKLLARLGAIGMVSVTAFAGVAPRADAHSFSFKAALTGEVRATISGNASFGRVASGTGAPTVFILDLGADSSEGAVLFTRTGGTRVGSYKVSNLGSGPEHLEALVRLGRADRPDGVFRARAGTLTITSISDNVLTGLFALDVTGSLASVPQFRKNQRVSVSGSFTARADD